MALAEPFTDDPTAVSSRWRPLSDAEALIVPQKLTDAALILAAQVPGLVARVAAGEVSPALVKQVQAEMVLRVLKNPDGKRQEAIDDYSWTRDSALSAGALYVTAAEVTLLSPATELRVGTIRLGAGLA